MKSSRMVTLQMCTEVLCKNIILIWTLWCEYIIMPQSKFCFLPSFQKLPFLPQYALSLGDILDAQPRKITTLLSLSFLSYSQPYHPSLPSDLQSAYMSFALLISTPTGQPKSPGSLPQLLKLLPALPEWLKLSSRFQFPCVSISNAGITGDYQHVVLIIAYELFFRIVEL